MPELGQSALRKVLRWVVWISTYNYVFIQIRGDENLWADLLTSWSIQLNIRSLATILPFPSTFR